MGGTVISIRPEGKARTHLRIKVDFGQEQKTFTVSEGTYREIGCPLSGEIIDGEALEQLIREGGERDALKRALSILSYADNNKKSLARKLYLAGFNKSEVEYALRECIAHGYIDERRQLERLIISLHEKLIGPSKIYARLLSKGYSGADISAVMSRLASDGELDFSESKRRLLEKFRPEGHLEKQKLLYKYGYKNEND